MKTVRNLALPILVLVAWEAAGRTGAIADYLSYPSQIATTFWDLTLTGELPLDFAISAMRAYGGFAIGGTAGVIVGIAAGQFRPVQNFFEPLVSLLYPIPKIAFLPVIILWLGLGDGSKIAIIAMSVFFPTFLAAFYAARQVDRVYLWSARSMGARGPRVFFRIVLPASLPQIFTGLRVGLALAFIVLFAAELMASRAGLGFLIVDGEDGVRFDMMFAGIFAIAIMGFISDRLLLVVRRRLLAGQLLRTQGEEV
jgi:ABC-type nitrate/sulfonate/bicarbonate transport system permease component